MIYKKYKTFNLCFILILYYLFFRVESFTPVGRIGHSSVLVGDKLYFFGGISAADVYGLNEVIDNAGKMYSFGGYTDQAFDEPGPTHINDMVSVNTVGLSW